MLRAPIASEVVVMLVGHHEILKSQLRNQGFCVLTASTGEEALDLSRQFVDTMALITDMDIGSIGAVELYSQIRKQRPQTQVLFISSQTDRLPEPPPGAEILEAPFRMADFLDKLQVVLPGSVHLRN
ncbi:MAG TPA: response regulator [Bryobacteraceae bacterium]|jgi:DNA-binding response OmpR family regulator